VRSSPQLRCGNDIAARRRSVLTVYCKKGVDGSWVCILKEAEDE